MVTKLLESAIQRQVCDYLALKRYFFWRNNNTPIFQFDKGNPRFRAMPKYTMKGIPDIILLKDGVFMGLEIKRPGGKLSEAQEIFRGDCRRNGGEYHVIMSLDDVIALGL